MKVLVTGGAGFIGSHIVDRLVVDGHAVDVIDDLSTGSTTNVRTGVPLAQLDLADGRTVDRIRDMNPECVVHCAAQVSVHASFVDPVGDARRNVLGGLNAISGAASAGSRIFIYVTTGGALYGEPEYVPTDEDHPIQPISPYGVSKWALEKYLHALLPSSVRSVVLRLANVYGPRQPWEGEGAVVAIFAARMREGLPVEIHGDGEQTRDFVYVRDVVDSVVAAMDRGLSATVNIGTGIGTSINTLFGKLAQIADYRQIPAHVSPRAGDVRRSVLAVERARSLLGWSPATHLDIGLRETYQGLEPPESS